MGEWLAEYPEDDMESVQVQRTMESVMVWLMYSGGGRWENSGVHLYSHYTPASVRTNSCRKAVQCSFSVVQGLV
jgi:hypothetical protein